MELELATDRGGNTKRFVFFHHVGLVFLTSNLTVCTVLFDFFLDLCKVHLYHGQVRLTEHLSERFGGETPTPMGLLQSSRNCPVCASSSPLLARLARMQCEQMLHVRNFLHCR